jgi:exoribonuclease R
MNIFIGKIRTNRKGMGFFRGEGVADFVTIMNEDMNTALDFDEVEIEVIGKNK